jgi:diguanylate cyclase (GGDEF)-like protein
MLDYSKIFFILPFIAAVLSFFFGFYTIYYKSLGKISISFSVYSFSISIVAIAAYISAVSLEINIAEISARISNLFILISMPALFIFALNLIQFRLSKVKWYFRALFFIPSTVLGVWLCFQEPEVFRTVNYGFVSSRNEFIMTGLVAIPFGLAIITLLSIKINKNLRKKYFSGSILFLLIGTILTFIWSMVYVLLYGVNVVGLIPFVETMYFLQYIFASIAILSIEQNMRSLSYKKLLANLDDATIILDEYGTIVDINRKMVEILKPSEKIYKKFSIFDSDHLKELLLKRTKETKKVENIFYALSLKDNNGFSDEISLKGDTKEQRYYNVTVSPIKVGRGTMVGKFAIFKDITAYKIKENELRYLSFHDGMTDLYNRTFMEEELNRLDTERQLPLSVVMGDINGLKIINDSYGHQKGDELLCKIASILKDNFRREDIISRWGGDEFLVLLPKTSIKDTDSIVRRIKSECKQKSTPDLPLSISLGVAVKTRSNQELAKIIKDAEDNMYSFKFEEQRSIHNTIISSLEKTLEEKDFETEAHAKRLKELAIKIGKELKLSDRKLNELSLLSALHDLGKVSIADEILSKPGKLTTEEWKMVKKHPEVGYRIAETTSKLEPIAEGILYHHERWDGKGYPRGLGKIKIPLNARIISIVDLFDAMTHRRPYKAAKSKQEAVKELKRCSGTQFDPNLVKIMIRILG